MLHAYEITSLILPQAVYSTSFALSIFTDVLITLTFYAYLDTSKTGLYSTDRVLSSLSVYIVNRGLLIMYAYFLPTISSR
jgi:hypothetical protein